MANILTQTLARLFPRAEEKASAAATAIVATSVGTAVWTPRNFAQFADEGYRKNAIAFHCISMIAQSGAYVPLLLEDKKSHMQIEDHPLLNLLAKPAPNVSRVELIERILTFLKIAGNSYVEAVGPDRKNAPPLELYSLRPDCMKLIAGKDAIPMAYEYEANGRKVRWDVDPISGMSKILHLRNFNPLNDWYGQSALEPASYSIDLHNEAGEHNMALLQNGAVPSGGLIFRPVTVEGQSHNAPPEVIAAAEKRLEERHNGARNAGRPMVLGGNVDWESFGLNLEQLQLSGTKLDAAWDICTTLGVPPILVLPGQSTYNNNREAKLAFYEETVLPNMSSLLDHLNNWLVPQFGDNLRLILDLDSVDALSLRREEKRKTYVELFDKRVVNRQEFREALDYEPMADLPPFDSLPHEVNAVVSLINGGKLSMETGFTQLVKWGVLPEGIDPADEKDKIDQESGGVDGLTGLDGIDPLTGLPVDPAAKPAPGLPAPAKPKLVN